MILLMLMYGVIIGFGAKTISDGSELLLEVRLPSYLLLSPIAYNLFFFFFFFLPSSSQMLRQ